LPFGFSQSATAGIASQVSKCSAIFSLLYAVQLIKTLLVGFGIFLRNDQNEVSYSEAHKVHGDTKLLTQDQLGLRSCETSTVLQP
jgi:hypothetical protein